MARLYPPIIEGVIPAFYGTQLRVPFSMNKSVSTRQVKGFALKMKTIISGDNPIENIIQITHDFENDDNIAIFPMTVNDEGYIEGLHIGQFYKIQIAYIDTNDDIGHYSTIGIIKYTSEPSVTISSHGDKITYTGIYQSSDHSEKVYTYNFTLTDNLGNIIETTGDKVHNGSADTIDNSSIDSYVIKTTLEVNKEYYLTYSVTTINNVTITSEAEKVSHLGGVNSSLRADIKCILDEENGCIDVHLVKPVEDESETPAVGTFYLLRASDEDGFKIWNEVLKFVLGGQTPVRHLWTDMSIKHGITYKYAVQQINKYNLRSGLIESKPIAASFDHMYLYDGKRQLKIKYNPKVSTFKNTLLESKIDTIGSKYPFVFRNGNVNYKEFSISGLISYLSDDNGLFYDTENIFDQHVNYGRSLTNLTSDNITTERDFKLQVLEWITNGKPKLFRSPTEGNYIVRLMNSSMTPNDTLGRMLHTFTSTAYEIAENTYENLKEFNFVHANINIDSQLRWKSIDLKDIDVKKSSSDNLLNHPAVAIKLEGMLPGSKINIRSDNSDMNSVIIGATGYYEINLNSGTTISMLSLPESSTPYMGVLTYAYYSTSFEDSFDSIISVEKLHVPCRQFIGLKGCNLLDEIIDIKTEINNIDYIRFILRNEHPTKVYKKGDVFYTHSTSEENKYVIDLAAYSDLFEVYDKDMDEEYWMDGYNATIIDPNDSLNTKIIINNDQMSSIDLINSWIYELKNPPSITSIEIGAAVIAEIGYTAKDIKYDIEDETEMSENLKEKNSALESAKLFYKAKWESGGSFPSDLKWAQQNLNNAYKNYIQALEQEIKKEV